MNEDILKLADGCCKDKNFETYEFGDNELEAFYKAAFNAAMTKERVSRCVIV